MKKPQRHLPTIIFCAFIAVMLILFIVLPKQEYSSSEKRYLAEPPKASAKNIFSGKFESEFEKYINDHTAFRPFWVGLNSYYEYLMGENGKNGYYLCKNGYIVTDPTEQNKLDTNIEIVKELKEKTNIDTKVLIAPSTGYICDDILPNNHLKYNDDEMFDKIQSELKESDIEFIDIRDKFKDEYKNGNQLYYKTDHHWTSYGAYTAYTCLSDSLEYSANKIDAYTIDSINNFYGTTYSSSGFWFTSPDKLEVWDKDTKTNVYITDGPKEITNDNCFFRDNLDGDDQYTVFLDGNHPYYRLTNENAQNDEHLLIIKDSFAHSLTPFISDHYKDITMIDMRYYKESVSKLIEKENIDKVLYIYSIDNFATDGDIAFIE